MLMQDKFALVTGVANHRSIAWAIARALDREGARLALSYLSEREKAGIEKIADQLQNPPLVIQCNAGEDDSVQAAFAAVQREFGRLDGLVHSIAFAKREDLDGRFIDTSRDGFQLALNISAFTLNTLAQAAEPLMGEGGGIAALTYLGSERVIPNYNVMGVAKAALEASVRYLAADMGPKGIRVNGVSAGPLKTLAARGIRDFSTMHKAHADRAALKRNTDVEEVADTTLFLCSHLSRGITGEIIYVDGGYRIMGM